ncbi:glycine betaine/L-proline ABC transporter ATP-binding protein [Pseudoclavibacter chungangensis]|uniref:Glycine betaine/L-proline ABC transporter ATP-binding protein n=1 Tax=Pseudoclavibacter chungangensis TaxID=587635 RepID=A0A7J5C0G2_9MICO|nr:glycine betaine/L-proline ABC transporter ATP-binding protein [Pseudoclavibacter chungangensis]KAB1660381.1 glycine betaine/L-proline ABC transporter ATP-binding protein [Pseudoclavibacter chungangensis]NYJ65745.1 glycine betaine/proline transport system ATP-binding protein [Pseudoclavibacter chungangensis]
MGEPPISVRGVYKVFGRRASEAVRQLEAGAERSELDKGTVAAVIDATFDVNPGEIFVVMGLSGSGKSTLIRALNGLHDVTAGSVLVHGVDLAKANDAEIRRVRQEHVSMVFQHFALFPHRTVIENVAFGLEVKGVDKAERTRRAQEMIDQVGLTDWADRLPSALSGGMQQRVGIARALASGTDILLMDEAFSALDPLIRREMQQELIDLQAELGKTIVFITHDLNEAMFLGDRIAVMRDGRIVQIGTPEEILTDPANDYVAQFVQDVDRARVLTAESVMEPARAVVPTTAGPRGALRVMRDTQSDSAFVTARGRVLLGAVTDRRVLHDIKAGVTELQPSIITDIATASPDTSVSDLLELSVDSRLPIAVVDEQRRLQGVVPRVTLLAALANVPTVTGAIDLPDTSASPLLDTQATGLDEPTDEVVVEEIIEIVEEPAHDAPTAGTNEGTGRA